MTSIIVYLALFFAYHWDMLCFSTRMVLEHLAGGTYQS